MLKSVYQLTIKVMKKIIIGFIILIILAPSTLAATLVSDYYNTLIMSQTRDLAPVTVTATADTLGCCSNADGYWKGGERIEDQRKHSTDIQKRLQDPSHSGFGHFQHR